MTVRIAMLSPFVVLLPMLAGCPAAPAPAPSATATTATGAPASAAPSSTAASPPPAPIDGATAKKLVHDGARLVDVRTPEEYGQKHVDGAVNVPVAVIAERDLGDREAPVVVYCASGNRSARAATTLRGRGYTHVYDLGAMSNWDD